MADHQVVAALALSRQLAMRTVVEVRRSGSHVVMQLHTDGTTITGPVPDHAELRLGTLRAIIRQSHLPRSLFEG